MPYQEGDELPNPPLDDDAIFDEELAGEDDYGESPPEKVSALALRPAKPLSRPSSGISAKRTVLKKKKKKLTINLNNCRYEVVKTVAENKSFKVTEDEDRWDLYWIDTSVSAERVMRMKSYQKINHFPGMFEISRKVNLARNLRRLQEQFPQEYSFFPQTFLLPYEYAAFKNALTNSGDGGKGRRKARTYIVKPDAGCQGKGIFLTRTVDDVKQDEKAVAQRYLHKPLLMDGLKFDLRIYVLILSCDPLRLFLYKEGMARFATEQYVEPNASNLDKTYVHLTNYSLNKLNENFVKPSVSSSNNSATLKKSEADPNGGDDSKSDSDGDSSSKRPFTSVLKRLQAEGHDPEKIWKDISDIIIKTFLTVQPSLSHIYRTCAGTASVPKDDETDATISARAEEVPKENASVSSMSAGDREDTKLEGGADERASQANKVPYLQWISKFKCFEILGFDIMLDHRLKPWLIEINHSPSFHTDSEFDLVLKEGVLRDTVNLIHLTPLVKKKALQFQKADATSRLTRYMKARAKISAEREAAERFKAKIERKPGGEPKKNVSSRMQNNKHCQPPPPPSPSPDRIGESKDLKTWWAEKKIFENKHCGKFDLIYPSEDDERMTMYRTIMERSTLVFNETIMKHKRKNVSNGDDVKEKEREKDKEPEKEVNKEKTKMLESDQSEKMDRPHIDGDAPRSIEDPKHQKSSLDSSSSLERNVTASVPVLIDDSTALFGLHDSRKSSSNNIENLRNDSIVKEGDQSPSARKRDRHPFSAPPPIVSARKSTQPARGSSASTTASVEKETLLETGRPTDMVACGRSSSSVNITTSLPSVYASDRANNLTATPLSSSDTNRSASTLPTGSSNIHPGRDEDVRRSSSKDRRLDPDGRHIGEIDRHKNSAVPTVVPQLEHSFTEHTMSSSVLEDDRRRGAVLARHGSSRFSTKRHNRSLEREERDRSKDQRRQMSSRVIDESDERVAAHNEVVGRLTARLKEYTRVLDGEQKIRRDENVRRRVQEELESSRQAYSTSMASFPRRTGAGVQQEVREREPRKFLFPLPKTELRLPANASHDMTVQGRGTNVMLGKHYF